MKEENRLRDIKKGSPQKDDKLSQYVTKHAFDKNKGVINNQKLSMILANVYFNMFSSDQIFKPIYTEEQEVKKYEYAPFHALAQFISEQGYAGMIYKSTVHKNGTNLVLFDANDAFVVQNTMEHVKLSDYSYKTNLVI